MQPSDRCSMSPGLLYSRSQTDFTKSDFWLSHVCSFVLIERLGNYRMRRDMSPRRDTHEKCDIWMFTSCEESINPLNLELNPICYLLALLAHHFLHVSRIRAKSLTIRLLMSYIHGAPILDVSRSHNDAPQSVGLLWTSDQLVAETST